MDIDFNELEGFDWNQGNLEHIKKHNVKKEECEEIFFNKPLKVNEDKKHSSEKETRFEAFGKTNEERNLFLVFTVRKNRIRVISARDQNRKERSEYEKET